MKKLGVDHLVSGCNPQVKQPSKGMSYDVNLQLIRKSTAVLELVNCPYHSISIMEDSNVH